MVARAGPTLLSSRAADRGGPGAGGAIAGSRRSRAPTSSAAARATMQATSSRSRQPGTWAGTRTTPSSGSRSPSSPELPGEAPSADRSLGAVAGPIPELPVGGDEPVGLELGGPADQPVVRAFPLAGSDEDGAVVELMLTDQTAGRRAVEDDHHLPSVLGTPCAASFDQLVLRDVRPLRAEHVSRVDEDGLQSYRPANLKPSRHPSLPRACAWEPPPVRCAQ